MLKHILTSRQQPPNNNNISTISQNISANCDMSNKLNISHSLVNNSSNNCYENQQTIRQNAYRFNNSRLTALDTSKHSTTSGLSVGPKSATTNPNTTANGSVVTQRRESNVPESNREPGIEETLTSLGLLCLVSLLLALLSLIFLLKISPNVSSSSQADGSVAPEELAVVYEVTLALCALTLSLNLCCLLVCAVQFLFAVKLSKYIFVGRTNKYLQKSAVSRVCAVGGFFISIPVFLTGVILYTFVQFHSTPAIVTSAFIGVGIVFCGAAMIHNVLVWQREKTEAARSLSRLRASGNGTRSVPSVHTTTRTHQPVLPHLNTSLYTLSPPPNILHQGHYIIRPPTSTPPAAPHSPASPPNTTGPIDLSNLTPQQQELSTLV